LVEVGTRLVRAPSGVCDHQPEEMTVRVRAGTTVAELEEVVGIAGQRTALPARGGTVGGALAVGQNDVRVLVRGPVRQAVLQMTFVSSEGEIVVGGAPTVKNVSGFDLPRLLVGSLGTLGLIGEVILRTNPVPSVSAWLACPEVDPFAVAPLVYKPSAVLWDGTRTWVHLEGHATDVSAKRGVLDALGPWTEVAEAPELPPHRWSLQPAQLRTLDDAATGPFVASVGVGTVFATRPQVHSELPAAMQALSGRVKKEFDPSGRLSPGRFPMGVTSWT